MTNKTGEKCENGIAQTEGKRKDEQTGTMDIRERDSFSVERSETESEAKKMPPPKRPINRAKTANGLLTDSERFTFCLGEISFSDQRMKHK